MNAKNAKDADDNNLANADENPQKQELQKAAFERSEKIKKHREEVIARRPLPKVVSSKTIVKDGRIITLYLMDGSKEFGRGKCYWIAA